MFKNGESPACIICQSKLQDPFMEVPNRFNLRETFQLVRCRNCQFVFLSPRPDQQSISAYYEDEDYQPHQDQAATLGSRIYQWVRIWNNRYKRKIIEKLITRGSLLDYGCGTGEFLLEMNNSGWATFGFEPSAKAAGVARSYGIEIIENILQLQQSVNIISLWHVLEHIHQPA